MPWLQDPKLAILKAAPACCAGKSMPRINLNRLISIVNFQGFNFRTLFNDIILRVVKDPKKLLMFARKWILVFV